MIKNRITTTLVIFSILLITTCSNDKNLTGSNNTQSLLKPYGENELYQINTLNFDEWLTSLTAMLGFPVPVLGLIFNGNPVLAEKICFFAYLVGLEEILFDDEDNCSIEDSQSGLYNFRDYYLNNTTKGQSYIAAYYALSKYGIDNNLINKYYKDHTHLLVKSIKIAKELQYNLDNDNITISNDLADSIINLISVYREHPNHRDIDPILDYLEADLIKYKNKPKSFIKADFN